MESVYNVFHTVTIVLHKDVVVLGSIKGIFTVHCFFATIFCCEVKSQTIVFVVAIKTALLLVVCQALYGVSAKGEVAHYGVIERVGRNFHIYFLNILFHVFAHLVGYIGIGVVKCTTNGYSDGICHGLYIIALDVVGHGKGHGTIHKNSL